MQNIQSSLEIANNLNDGFEKFKNTIILGDCIKQFKYLPDNSIDC